MRTKEEVKQQIEGLKNQKIVLPEFSMFGDNNWEKIDAKIDVLEGLKDPDDFYEDETSDEYQDGDNDLFFAAEEAERWLDGESDEDLFA